MAVLWMDNFSSYGTGSTGQANMLNGVWAQVDAATLENDPDGVSGGQVLYLGPDGNTRRVFPGSFTTVGLAFRIWYPYLPTGDNNVTVLSFRDINNIAQISLEVHTTGALSILRGEVSGGTILGTTAGPVITAEAWHHIEIKAFASQTVGTVEVRVDGVPRLTITGADTVASSLVEFSQILFQRGSNVLDSPKYIKDLISWDSSGSVNNDFLGDVQIISLTPASDDTFTGWGTSSGSTGYNLINETTPNDSSYISAASPPPSAAIFTLTDLPSEIVTVKALQPTVRMLKTDGGTATVQTGMISSASVDEGEDRPITVAATYWWDISEVDPNTGSAWTPTSVNNSKLKINRTS